VGGSEIVSKHMKMMLLGPKRDIYRFSEYGHAEIMCPGGFF